MRHHVSQNSVQCHNPSVPGDFGMLLIIRHSNLSLIPFQVLCTIPTAFRHFVKTFDSKVSQLCHAAKNHSCVMLWLWVFRCAMVSWTRWTKQA